MGSRGQERDFETEISGNAMVYGVTVEWVAEERGEKIVGMQDIKEWRGQAAGWGTYVGTEVLRIILEEGSAYTCNQELSPQWRRGDD